MEGERGVQPHLIELKEAVCAFEGELLEGQRVLGAVFYEEVAVVSGRSSVVELVVIVVVGVIIRLPCKVVHTSPMWVQVQCI